MKINAADIGNLETSVGFLDAAAYDYTAPHTLLS